MAKHDLHGQTVRVEVVQPSAKSSDWIEDLKAWIEEFKVPGVIADDSRESIYSGTSDDPR